MAEAPPPPQGREPILNLPPVTAALAVVLLAIHGLREFLDVATDNWLVLTFGVIPARFTAGPGLLDLLSLVSYMLLHGSWLHLGFNLVALVAFGAGIERLLGGGRMLFALLLGGVGGVLLHILLYAGDPTPLIGASGGLSALFGLTMFALAMRSGGWRRLLSVTALWLGLNLAFGLIGVPGEEGVEIAWVAHMGGYFAGLAYGTWLMRHPVRRP
ncbi:MAG: rhomboid family intramembrane serine protease [Reyranellaceae bacterium]